jgi:membrane protein implicated in regulation of membrane protease activity
MSDEPATRGPARRGPYIAVGVILALGILLPLIVPIYAHAEPALAGLPFFYWYQMLWVLIEAVLLLICYRIIRREDRRRRDAVRSESRR